MHKKALLLYGAAHNDLFDGVVWRDDAYENTNNAADTVQKLLDAAHAICERAAGNLDAGEALVDNLIENWKRTGLVDGTG